MEALYSNLYKKYTNIKAKKFSELDQLNADQEVKFVSYVSAAEDLINHLKNENDRMHVENNDLRSEVATLRSAMDEKCVEYQRLLMEENQKNAVLSEEIEKLRKLQEEGHFEHSEGGENNHRRLATPVSANAMRENAQDGSAKKRRRRSVLETEEGTQTLHGSARDDTLVRESANDLCLITENDWKPDCCKRTTDGSGGIHVSGSSNCLFQALVQNLLGLKLSEINRTDGLSVSALHQSSGYSFSLTWVSKASEEEAELMYRVQSLGTFERVAPDWMREVLMFSSSMCPVFFERVARIIKLHP